MFRTWYISQRVIARLLSFFTVLMAATALLIPSASSLVSAAGMGNRMALFEQAAQEFDVPVSVLLAISYNQTRWQAPDGPSIDGGNGLMGLRTALPVTVSGRDGHQVPAAPRQPADYYTLDQAAGLLHISLDTVKTDENQNIRGAAAVLAEDARQLNGGRLPTNLADWYSPVAKFGGAITGTPTSAFADDVFASMQRGVSLTTPDGQTLHLPAAPSLQPNKGVLPMLGLQAAPQQKGQSTALSGQVPECPAILDCRFVPAAYALDDPTDPTNYGNYDLANRPHDMPINYIFIHDTEGSYDGTISWFQNPAAYVSAQYVVRSSDGAITQMVRNSDVSWGVYDWYDNTHGINIETEGFASQGAQWYTPSLYQKLATLVRLLGMKYHIPLDRQHILGHDNIPVLRAANFPNQHWDPGPFWNWDYFMALVHGKNLSQQTHEPTGGSPSLKKGDVVTIAPHFATNQPPLTDCQSGTCMPLPAQGASFVYLHTQPATDAPLLNDPYAHPGSAVGTTVDNDWGDKAPSGFRYVVADNQGDWTAIYFSGQIGWFYNPAGERSTAYHIHSLVIRPRAGLRTIAVYGAAYPEASAYPADVPVQQFDPLYTIAAGQAYTTTGENLPTDYFYAATIDFSLPNDHLIVRGQQKYYQISINHRIGYVRADDVTLRYQ